MKHLDRRYFLQNSLRNAALASTAASTLWLPRSAWSQTRISSNPFTLGIASGSPTHDSIVLWTRLAPSGLLGAVNLGADNITVSWEIAHDEAFTRIASRGQAQALAQLAHSVHVEVAGLEAGRSYFYRFIAGDSSSSEWTSPTGRTRTLPAAYSPAGRFRIAYASCQRWEHGYYSAYRHMLADQPDLVLFLGDYIYEYPRAANQVRTPNATSNGGWTLTLDDYRSRYALHKTDPDLQAMHAACPWAFTWDDHEVQNDYAALTPGDAGPAAADFAARRAAAYQAFYEHTPLRANALTRSLAGLLDQPAAEMRIYNEMRLGALGSIYLLDARQYKDALVCTKDGALGSSTVNTAQCPAWNDPARTMLGAAQEAWLAQTFSRNANAPGWQIIGQSSLFAPRDFKNSGAGATMWNDGWDGYSAARTRLTDALQKASAKNVVFFGGDVHENWVGHVKADFSKPRSPSIATEFCGTSITSRHFVGSTNDKIPERIARNPHFVFADVEKRGYGLADFTAQKLQVSLRTVSDVTSKDASIQTLAQFAVVSGKAVVERV
jgi:alkaline phosphatase D